ncbi:unnamed protein product [Nesidiocoris tenuis]|uniref:Uncharacterized protein n=1 Tax=Nesidiocoris tenuis TaxID=355587 RepID=A0A6H5GQE7_9HEMI|nr:unnamed protein product [Nesidiocoris tenuis]
MLCSMRFNIIIKIRYEEDLLKTPLEGRETMELIRCACTRRNSASHNGPPLLGNQGQGGWQGRGGWIGFFRTWIYYNIINRSRKQLRRQSARGDFAIKRTGRYNMIRQVTAVTPHEQCRRFAAPPIPLDLRLPHLWPFEFVMKCPNRIVITRRDFQAIPFLRGHLQFKGICVNIYSRANVVRFIVTELLKIRNASATTCSTARHQSSLNCRYRLVLVRRDLSRTFRIPSISTEKRQGSSERVWNGDDSAASRKSSSGAVYTAKKGRGVDFLSAPPVEWDLMRSNLRSNREYVDILHILIPSLMLMVGEICKTSFASCRLLNSQVGDNLSVGRGYFRWKPWMDLPQVVLRYPFLSLSVNNV